MRAPTIAADPALMLLHFEQADGIDEVRTLSDDFGAATPDIVEAVVYQAIRFSTDYLDPLNDEGDRTGSRLVDGRVKTCAGHREAWSAYAEQGWGTIDQPTSWGGQGLPRSLSATVQEICDRSCPGFGMLPVPQRSAARLIASWGDEAMKEEWLPRLVANSWGATICISEPDAGSDVARIRTTATPAEDGSWRISGEKCWITFGDHDLTPRIGHCLLARTPGGQGLSLFLVPNCHEDGTANGVIVRRVEEKMGLHISPTCVLGFEEAQGRLIGEEGRGLAQMFVMITNMRLATGVQGLASAGAALDMALRYAEERKQGGKAPQPVAIATHADVQRQLMALAGPVESMRGLVLALANHADIAAHAPDEARRADAEALVQWLLPIVKTKGGEIGFDVASGAMQVLGGAGYTREWPVEQYLRDVRVLTIFEGTTGMQAQDLVHRRLMRGDRRGLELFLTKARGAAATAAEAGADAAARGLGHCLDLLEDAVAWLDRHADSKTDIDAVATPFLRLASIAALGWAGARLAATPGDAPAARRVAAAGGSCAALSGAQALSAHAEVMAGAALIDGFAAVRPQ